MGRVEGSKGGDHDICNRVNNYKIEYYHLSGMDLRDLSFLWEGDAAKKRLNGKERNYIGLSKLLYSLGPRLADP